MRRSLLLFVLLVALAAPMVAAPRDDDPRGGGRDIISRLVHLVRNIVHALDEIVPMPPHP